MLKLFVIIYKSLNFGRFKGVTKKDFDYVSSSFINFCLFRFWTILHLNANESDIPRNIILIGWDGAQRNHIKECISRNELPDLEKLSSEGTLVAIDC